MAESLRSFFMAFPLRDPNADLRPAACYFCPSENHKSMRFGNFKGDMPACRVDALRHICGAALPPPISDDRR
jgi:hypothetical protein